MMKPSQYERPFRIPGPPRQGAKHRLAMGTERAGAVPGRRLVGRATCPAEAATKNANAALLKELPFSDKTSFELAHWASSRRCPRA